jgi:hypothetical protein
MNWVGYDKSLFHEWLNEFKTDNEPYVFFQDLCESTSDM